MCQRDKLKMKMTTAVGASVIHNIITMTWLSPRSCPFAGYPISGDTGIYPDIDVPHVGYP
jgi:hypothetical protein